MSSGRFFHLRRPRPLVGDDVGAYSYADVGATRTGPPAGWTVDRDVGVVGHGEADFRRGAERVRQLEMFDLPWIALLTPGPVSAGRPVTFASRQLGVWTLNACRVVYVVDEQDAAGARFGFAYGTLATHAVAGEERFLIEWDRATDEVRFEVFKFSRLRHPLVRAVAPVARAVQRRFSADAIARVRRAIAEGA